MPSGAMFWIDPTGRMISGTTHIAVIIANPEKFGITRKYIEDLHKKYNEKLGQEGEAREEIIRLVTRKGFIRIRQQRNYVSATVGDWTRKTKSILGQWAKKMSSDRSFDQFQPVKVYSVRDDKMKTYDAKELAQNKHLYEFVTIRESTVENFGIDRNFCTFREFISH